MSHPPHLTSSWSSAFIPFCAYKTNLNISKKSIALENTNFPICSSFVPTILEGQLCYKLMLNETSDRGKRNELMLLLDYNEDRSLETSSNNKDGNLSSDETLNFDTAVESIQGVAAKVHIDTLSPFTGFGGGIYTMTDVKKITAKGEFLGMPFKDRQCEIEAYEECRTRKLLEECKCLHWETGHQVSFSFTSENLSRRDSRSAIQKLKWTVCVCVSVRHHSNFSTEDPFKSLPMLHRPTKPLSGGCLVVSGGVWSMSGGV